MSDTGSGGGVTNDGGDDNSGPPQLVTIVSVDSSLSSSQVRPSLIKSASTPGKPNYVRQRPQLNRAQSIKERLTNETARFFGVPPLGDDDTEGENSVQVRLSIDEEDRKWQQRRFRHLKKQYAIKTDAIAEELQSKIGIDALAEHTECGVDAAETPSTLRQESGVVSEHVSSPDRKRRSVEAANSRLLRTCILPSPPPIERRKTVIKMTCDTISSILHGDYFRRFKRNRSLSTVNAANAGNNHFPLEPHPPTFHLHSSPSPEKADGSAATAIGVSSAEGEALANGSRNGSATSRVLAGGVLLSHNAEMPEFSSAGVFASSGMNGGGGGSSIPTSPSYKSIRQRPTVFGLSSFFTGLKSSSITASNRGSAGGYPIMADASTTSSSALGIYVGGSPCKSGISSGRRTTGRLAYRKLHQRSLPIFGKMVAWQLNDESCDYRPFFTYWITTVQTIIMLFMLFNYGIGSDFTSGFGVIERSGNVEASYSSIVHIVVWEQNNIWIGPRFADLVHAGAKYTPCMRLDPSIHEQIQRERMEESQHTGCCIGPNGCHQTSECPKQFARLVKWTGNNAEPAATNEAGNPTTTRVVCGQDPRFCLNPRSLFPFEWDRVDIAKWPICEKQTVHIPRAAEHMHCEITGRPCCIQMHGQCRITTREYCDFVRGYYHPNATLCSQVSCLNDVCGMTSFSSPDRPDQLFRLIIPLFIHAGIVRCAITIALQMSIMREFETMIGWFRLSIIYFASGIGGYLASAVFVPYMPEVGPAGSQGGVLGALIVNVVYNWSFLRRPHRVMAFHVAIAVVLFITGLLPYVDNWAQLFGFVFGCIFAAALIPYITFGRSRTRRRRRVLVVVGSLGLTLSLFLVLFALFFYANPSSSWLNYRLLSLMNCPLSSKVCDQQSLTLRSWLPI